MPLSTRALYKFSAMPVSRRIVAVAWIARGKWESAWYNPGPWFSTIAMNRPDITKTAMDGRWKT